MSFSINRESQTSKHAVAIAPAAILDNAAASSFVIDRNDFPGMNYGEFVLNIGATDIAAAVCRVQESDTKTDSTTLGGTPATVDSADTLPSATDDNKVAVFGIDFSKSRERYIQLQFTAGNGTAGTFVSATFTGYRLDTSDAGATDRGVLFAQYT